MEDIIPSDSLLYKIISFFSDYFEVFICVNGALLATFVLILILLKLREVDLWRALKVSLNGIFYYTVLIGQVTLVCIFIYVYWQNYEKPAPKLNVNRDALASTQWVKNNTRVYFIDDNKLRSIKVNDRDSEDVFEGKGPIKEYHFSPDGRHLLILTKKELFLVDKRTKNSQRIDALEQSDDQERQGEKVVIKGSISGIQWAPNSQKFVYEIARWSKVSTQDSVYLYDLQGQKKRAIKSPARRISSLYWDKQSANLYYFHHEAKDTSVDPSPFEVKVFRISLEDLAPELIVRIPYDSASLPVENLNLRDIDLFLDGNKFSFGRPGQENDLISDKGASLGIDEDDYLYLVNMKWFRKRLYKIAREPRDADTSRYQYRGGDLLIDHIRWIPGGRYVIMEHRYWGVLILEPSTGKVGLLIRANGHTFGWYQGAT